MQRLTVDTRSIPFLCLKASVFNQSYPGFLYPFSDIAVDLSIPRVCFRLLFLSLFKALLRSQRWKLHCNLGLLLQLRAAYDLFRQWTGAPLSRGVHARTDCGYGEWAYNLLLKEFGNIRVRQLIRIQVNVRIGCRRDYGRCVIAIHF